MPCLPLVEPARHRSGHPAGRRPHAPPAPARKYRPVSGHGGMASRPRSARRAADAGNLPAASGRSCTTWSTSALGSATSLISVETYTYSGSPTSRTLVSSRRSSRYSSTSRRTAVRHAQVGGTRHRAPLRPMPEPAAHGRRRAGSPPSRRCAAHAAGRTAHDRRRKRLGSANIRSLRLSPPGALTQNRAAAHLGPVHRLLLPPAVSTARIDDFGDIGDGRFQHRRLPGRDVAARPAAVPVCRKRQ